MAFINKNLLVCRIKWEPLNQSIQTLQLHPSAHAYYMIRFGEHSVRNFFLPNLPWKLHMCFFKVKHYWTYLRNGWSDWCETKRRCIGLILGELCDLCGMEGLISMERKGCELITHDHDRDLWVTMVWWVEWIYRIVTGVISDISVPSTYLVCSIFYMNYRNQGCTKFIFWSCLVAQYVLEVLDMWWKINHSTSYVYDIADEIAGKCWKHSVQCLALKS